MTFTEDGGYDGDGPIMEARDCEVCGEQFVAPIHRPDIVVCHRKHD